MQAAVDYSTMLAMDEMAILMIDDDRELGDMLREYLAPERLSLTSSSIIRMAISSMASIVE